MKRLAKYLATAAVLFALLLCAGGWLVGRWVSSAAVRASIEEELGRALRLPVKLARLDFSLTGGLKVDGLTVAGDHGAFSATAVSANHRLLPLLGGKIALGEVRIDGPKFRISQDADGKWRFAAPAPQQPAPATTALAAAPAEPKPRRKPTVAIAQVMLTGGEVEMIDKSGKPFLTVSGLDVTLRDATPESFTGGFRIGRALLHGFAAIHGIQGTTTRKDGVFALRDFSGQCGGGHITGEATFPASGAGTATLALEEIALHIAANEAGISSPLVSGILSGEAKAAGLGDTNTMTGEGRLVLKNGSSREIELLRQIGDVLRVASLSTFEVGDATATFQVANGEVMLSPLHISAPPIALAFVGPVKFDGTVNLTSFLDVPAGLIDQNPVLAAQFLPANEAGHRAIHFTVTGPLTKPKQTLAASLTGTTDRRQQRIIAAGAILSEILNRTQKKKDGAQPAPAQP